MPSPSKCWSTLSPSHEPLTRDDHPSSLPSLGDPSDSSNYVQGQSISPVPENRQIRLKPGDHRVDRSKLLRLHRHT